MKYSNREGDIIVDAITIKEALQSGYIENTFIKHESADIEMKDDDYVVTWNSGIISLAFKIVFDSLFKPI